MEQAQLAVPNRTSDYYEDVDPRFAEPMPPPPTGPSSLVPAPLIPGHLNALPNHSSNSLNIVDPNTIRHSNYPEDNDGSRSPAASEISHFTSISQRGINPAWRPAPGGELIAVLNDLSLPANCSYTGPPMPGAYGPGPGPRRPMRQEDMILEANAENPDFAIPGVNVGRGRGRGRGGRGGGAVRGGLPPLSTPAANMGLGSQGRLVDPLQRRPNF